jgi:hypothetical protein
LMGVGRAFRSLVRLFGEFGDIQLRHVLKLEINCAHPGCTIGPLQIRQNKQLHCARACHIQEPQPSLRFLLALSIHCLREAWRGCPPKPSAGCRRSGGAQTVPARSRSDINRNHDRPLKSFRTMNGDDKLCRP